MALPLGDFTDYAERRARAVGQGGVAGEFLVGEVGIVDDPAGRLDDVDPFAPRAPGQLGAPDRRLERAGQIDPGRILPRAIVGGMAGGDQVAGAQVRAGAVIIGHVVLLPRLRIEGSLMAQGPRLAASPVPG